MNIVEHRNTQQMNYNPLEPNPFHLPQLDSLTNTEIDQLGFTQPNLQEPIIKNVIDIFTALTHIMFGLSDNNIFTVIQTIMVIMNNVSLQEYSKFMIEKKKVNDEDILLYNLSLGINNCPKIYCGMVFPNTNLKHNDGESIIKEIIIEPQIIQDFNLKFPETKSLKIVAYSIHKQGIMCLNI